MSDAVAEELNKPETRISRSLDFIEAAGGKRTAHRSAYLYHAVKELDKAAERLPRYTIDTDAWLPQSKLHNARVCLGLAQDEKVSRDRLVQLKDAVRSLQEAKAALEESHVLEA